MDLLDVREHRVVSSLLKKPLLEVERMANDEFLQAMGEALLPADAHEVLSSLQRIKMAASADTRANLCDYIGAFELVLADLPARITPPTKRVVRIFVDGLADENLRELIAEAEPDTLAKAVECALASAEAVRQARLLLRGARAAKTADDPPKDGRGWSQASEPPRQRATP